MLLTGNYGISLSEAKLSLVANYDFGIRHIAEMGPRLPGWSAVIISAVACIQNDMMSVDCGVVDKSNPVLSHS